MEEFSESNSPSDDERWHSGAIRRCRHALSEASTVGDRLALLRSIARLQGNRVVPADEGVVLSANDRGALRRFGLALTGGGDVLRLNDDQDARAPEGFDESERVDTALRALRSEAFSDAVLRRHTPHKTYRTPAQKAAMRALLTMPDGAGLMVSMPTGSGKSLLFQLDSLVGRKSTPGRCSIVITPTVALALDHARALSQIPGLEQSRALTGDVKNTEREALLSAFRRGEIPILLLSPEFALGAAREALIEAATAPEAKYAGLNARLEAIFVDEAHIVEQWGRSFRPDFQRLPALIAELRGANPALRTVLLSATITPAARRELRRGYGAAGPWLEIGAQTPRYEFDIVIQPYGSAEHRQEALDYAIDRAPRPMIVYTTRVKDAEDQYERMRERGFARVALFTGDVTDASERRRIIDEWAADNLDVVVATSAFGMGVDKSSVRTVVHACLPEGPSRWYQEIGRAARDGRQGLAVCLYTRPRSGSDDNDVADARSQAMGSWLTRELAEERWRALLEKRMQMGWRGANRRLTLNLDALRTGLKSRASSDANRSWNMSLINLMQRSGALDVVSVSMEDDMPGSVWEVEIKDPTLLNPDDHTAWDRIYEVRDAEQAEARSELNRFIETFAGKTRRCLLLEVFEMVEGEDLHHLPPCGRCPTCRKLGLDPPGAVKQRGLEHAWSVAPKVSRGPLPPEPTLIAPVDADFEAGLAPLLRRLSAVGVEQFVVPDALAPRVAEILAQSTARIGLVLGCGEWVGPPETSLARLPTAMLLPLDEGAASRLLSRCRAFFAAAPGVAIAVVARPERMVDDRRLDQTVSRLAPYSEAWLEGLVAPREEVA